MTVSVEAADRRAFLDTIPRSRFYSIPPQTGENLYSGFLFLSLARFAGPNHKRHETKMENPTVNKRLRPLLLIGLMGGLLASQSAFAGERGNKTTMAPQVDKTCAAWGTQTRFRKAARQATNTAAMRVRARNTRIKLA